MNPSQTPNNRANDLEARRLERQYGIYKAITKSLLIPPKIKAHLSSLGRPPVIADVATGTGAWLRDLARSVPPESRLDGFDIDTSKFLSAQRLPPNVQLVHGDALRPFPAELRGAYDLVHVQLLMYDLRTDEWETVAANMRTLLRPGGYLLWADSGPASFRCVPMTRLFMKWYGTELRDTSFACRDVMSPRYLRDDLESVGFVNCMQRRFSSFRGPVELQKPAGKALIALASQSLHGMVDRGGFEWVRSHDEVSELVNALRADIDDDVTQVGFTIYWTFGQNPIHVRSVN